MSAAMTAHVVVEAEVRGFHSLRCSHCGALHLPEPPLTVEQLAVVCRGFVLMHKHCPKPVAASKQTELFNGLGERLGEGPRRLGHATYVGFPGYKREAEASVALDRHPDTRTHVIDGTSDEPDPETDPGEGVDFHSCYCGARFPESWQRTEHWETCHIYLGKEPKPDPLTSLSGPPLVAIDLWRLIKCVRPKEFWPPLKDIERWHPDVRTRVQDWCRNEHAHASPIAGVTLPERTPLPNVLAALEFPHPKTKRGARPLSSGPKKAKARKARSATAPNGSSA